MVKQLLLLWPKACKGIVILRVHPLQMWLNYWEEREGAEGPQQGPKGPPALRRS